MIQKILTGVFGRKLVPAFFCLVLFSGFLSVKTLSAQQTLYAISGASGTPSILYTLDPSNGTAVSTVGNTGLTHMTALAVHPQTGVIYTAGFNPNTGLAHLYTLDPITAAPTSVGTIGNIQVPDMTFSASGVLYAWGEPFTDGLYTIDINTGASTLVGSCGCITSITGLAFNSLCSEQLYLKNANTISLLDHSNGQIISTVNISGTNSTLHNILAASKNNVMYSGQRGTNGFILKTVNPATGVVATVGTAVGVFNISAIAFGTYDALNANIGTITHVPCFGGSNGSIDLVVSGGVTPYTYSWSNGASTEDISGLASGTYSVTVTDANGCTATVSATVNQPAAALAVATTVTNVACHGGSTGAVDLTVSGGTPGYTYNWSNGASSEDISGLPAGTYSVTVTDANGCSESTSATVSEPATALTASSGGQTNVTSGNNGSATVVGSGGTMPYSYSWAPSGGTNATATSLGVGNYTATVTDANGCTATQTFEITQACNISFTASITNVSCNGQSNGAINVTMTSGAGSYSYSWSNGATTEDISGLAAGNYTLTVSLPNGCEVTETYTVTQPEPLVLSGTVGNVSCYNAQNGAIDVTVTGGTGPYTYTWADVNSSNWLLWIFYFYGQWCNNNNNNTNWPGSNINTQDRTGLDNGCYYVKVTDANGCTSITSFTVTQPTPICVSYTKTNAGCANNNGSINISVSGGTSPYTYLWSNGATTQDVSGLSAGTYTVTITDANGCSTTQNYSISQATGNISVSCVSSSNATCAASNGAINISVSGGNSPYTYQWSNGATTQDISGVPAGNYTVVITDANGCTKTQTYTVGQYNGNISISYTKCNAICTSNTGSINISVSGGNSPYTYQWSNGATTQDISNIPAGTYTVVVTDANGCTKSKTVTVSTNSADINVSVNKSNANCANTNGSINISVSGGTSPYTYQWSNGATTQDIYNLSAGTYTVVITDANGCTETKTYTISQSSGNLNASISVSPQYPVSGQAPYTIYLGYGAQTVCLSANISGGTWPYTKTWSTSSTSSSIYVSPTVTTTYTLTVTDANGCTDVATKTITVIDVQAPNNKIYVCHNGSMIAVSQSQVYSHLCHGDDLGPCSSYCRSAGGGDTETEDEAADSQSLSVMAEDLQFSVYPNPSKGMVTISLPLTGDVDVLVTDIAGKVVARNQVKDNHEQKLQMNLSSLARGVYVLRVQVGAEVWQQKLHL